MMNNSNRENETKKSKDNVPRSLARNSLYSIFSAYSGYFFSLLTSFFLARIITIEEWGFLITATSFITIITLTLSFFPLGLSESLNYYIPYYNSSNQTNKLKSLLINLFYFKLITAILMYGFSIIIISFFYSVFSLSLAPYTDLLFFLSPLIIITCLNSFLAGFNLGYGIFKFMFYLKLITNLILLTGYIIIFLFIPDINIEIIALITIFSQLVPFLINITIFYLKIKKIKSTKKHRISFKESYKIVSIYGGFSSSSMIGGAYWEELQKQSIRILESTDWVTGYNISTHFIDTSKRFITALGGPMITSFSALDFKENSIRITKIVRIVLKFSLFFTLLTTGLLFFIVDFYLLYIYGDNYLIFSLLMKIILLTSIFGLINTILQILIKTTNRVKLIPLIFIINISFKIIFFFIGLFFFGIIGAAIGLFISNLIILFISNYLLLKLFKVKSNFRKILLLYFIFFVSLLFAISMGSLFLNQVSADIFRSLDLGFFEKIEIFPIIIFLGLFMFLNYVFSIFTKKDIEYVELIFTKDKKTHNFIKKFLRFIKRFLK